MLRLAVHLQLCSIELDLGLVCRSIKALYDPATESDSTLGFAGTKQILVHTQSPVYVDPK